MPDQTAGTTLETPGRDPGSRPPGLLDSEQARRLVVTAQSHAGRRGQEVSVAVCDASGLLMAFGRTDGASSVSVEVAIAKAQTAARFGFPTADWALEPNRDLAHRLRDSGVAVSQIAGGRPLRSSRQVVGAIGVSGGTEEADDRVAALSVDAWNGTS